MRFFRELLEGAEHIAFPATCVACGESLPARTQFLCDVCATGRFEDANPTNADTCDTLILPQGVAFQDAIWHYDKAGALQKLMQMLKYEGMAGVGRELGELAGQRIMQRHVPQRFAEAGAIVLLPVPLHPKREQKRGYNQAREIAEGIATVLKCPVAPAAALIRSRNTATQTRFSFSKRMENLKDVFQLAQADVFTDRAVLIIDDVFTTGSTCFSVHEALQKAQPATVGIFTIAQA
ncbi:MAG: ComF family protein [Cyclonatronaceae bacterium]